MPRRTNKPKPKSKQNKSTRNSSENLRSFLGEGSTVEESSSETESFRSADLDGQTDYDLDFTSSHIQNRHLNKQNSVSGQSSKQVQEAPSSSAFRKKSAANHRNDAPAVSSAGQKKSKTAMNAQSSKTRSRKQQNPVRQQKNFLKDVRKLQNRTDNLIPRAPFSRLIREILHQESTSANRLTYTALLALQEASEMYLTSLFQDSYCCTLHRGRVTLIVKDMELVRFLRGRSDPGNR